MNDTNKKFLTVREVAAYLGMSVKTIYLWAESGKIPVCKFNHSLRFDPHEIAAFVKSRRLDVSDPVREAKKLIGKNLMSGDNPLGSGQRAP